VSADIRRFRTRHALTFTALIATVPLTLISTVTAAPDTSAAIRAKLDDLLASRAAAMGCAARGNDACLQVHGARITDTAVSLRVAVRQAARGSNDPAVVAFLHQQVKALTTVALTGRALAQTHATASARAQFNIALRNLARSTTRKAVSAPPADTSQADPPVFVAPPTTLGVSFTGMSPAFSPDAPDYGIRCTGGRTSATISAPVGTTVAVGGQPPVTAARVTEDVAVRPGRAVTFTVNDAQGIRGYSVRCLPDDFPVYSSTRPGSPQAEWYISTPDLFAGTGQFTAIFDNHGAPVWWQRMASYGMDAKLLPDGTLAWWVAAHDGDVAHYEIHALDGTLLHRVETVGVSTDNHDLQVLPNGNYVVLSYVPRAHVDLSADNGSADATVLDAEIQEVRPDGSLAWNWNSSTHITPAETDLWLPSVVGAAAVDLVHINSIEVSGNSIVFSARHLNAIYSIDRTTGAIEWKLGGTSRPESLAIVGDPALAAASFGGQHDARILPDGTLTLHDNGTLRNRAPRAVRYTIDTGARTATLLEQVQDAGIAASGCCGSARRLTGGNWVMGWGMNSISTENTPDGTRVFDLTFDGGVGTYRTVPVEPGVLSRTDLRGGMDQMPMG
jgi:hypothetical protein